MRIGLRRYVIYIALAAVVSACSAVSPKAQIGRQDDRQAEPQVKRDSGSETVAVNRYLWTASLDVLSFMPVQSIDPFTGVITFGYGTPSAGNTAYRATVYIDGPALDARALNVSMSTRRGVVSNDTLRAVEHAILTRARQLRTGR